MKIAILTQPLGHNYGGLLQAYALQVHLKKLGHDVETIDRREPLKKTDQLKNSLLNLIRLILGRINSLPTVNRQGYVLSKLTDFRDNFISMSPPILSEREIRDYFEKKEFDAVIVGSDQVWRPCYSPSLLNFYLDFLDDINSPAKRIAYAASFGVSDWEYSEETTQKCRTLASMFTSISVREKSGIDLCKNKLGVSARLVVDPSLLLDPADYELLITGENIKKDFVLSYVLDPEREKQFIAKIISDTLKMELLYIKPETTIVEVKSKDIDKCRYTSVEHWLQSFRYAKFVVTDSFHGTVFSILFNKPFIAIGNSSRGMARFESLLSQFNLMERLVKSEDEITDELILEPIDWQEINITRKLLANEGRLFIKENLLDMNNNG